MKDVNLTQLSSLSQLSNKEQLLVKWISKQLNTSQKPQVIQAILPHSASAKYRILFYQPNTTTKLLFSLPTALTQILLVCNCSSPSKQLLTLVAQMSADSEVNDAIAQGYLKKIPPLSNNSGSNNSGSNDSDKTLTAVLFSSVKESLPNFPSKIKLNQEKFAFYSISPISLTEYKQILKKTPSVKCSRKETHNPIPQKLTDQNLTHLQGFFNQHIQQHEETFTETALKQHPPSIQPIQHFPKTLQWPPRQIFKFRSRPLKKTFFESLLVSSFLGVLIALFNHSFDVHLIDNSIPITLLGVSGILTLMSAYFDLIFK